MNLQLTYLFNRINSRHWNKYCRSSCFSIDYILDIISQNCSFLYTLLIETFKAWESWFKDWWLSMTSMSHNSNFKTASLRIYFSYWFFLFFIHLFIDSPTHWCPHNLSESISLRIRAAALVQSLFLKHERTVSILSEVL